MKSSIYRQYMAPQGCLYALGLFFWSGQRLICVIVVMRTAKQGDLAEPEMKLLQHLYLVYNWKHNEANGEDNRDGDNNNNSWNCGVGGPTDDVEILRLRERQRRNFLATMFLSQGVPMLCAGDEFGRTQRGNNNAYCQDNEISWLNWQLNEASERLLRFVRRLIAFRREHPVFRRPKFFQGRPIRGAGIRDIMWFNSTGAEMTNAGWSSWFVRVLGMLLSGATMDERFPGRELPIICKDFAKMSHHRTG
jgi:isoamylase